MNTELRDRIIERIKDQVCDLLDEKAGIFFTDLEDACVAFAEDIENDGKTFKARLGIATVIEPRGTEAEVETTLSWSVKKRASAEAVVSLQPKLPGMAGGTTDE